MLIALTLPVGFTVMVNVLGVPAVLIPPLVYVGVTVIVAVIGAVVVLLTVKAAMLPVPLAARPIPGVSFVQAYVVVPPVFTVLNVTAVVLAPAATTWLLTEFIDGLGFTVTVNVLGVPAVLIPALV